MLPEANRTLSKTQRVIPLTKELIEDMEQRPRDNPCRSATLPAGANRAIDAFVQKVAIDRSQRRSLCTNTSTFSKFPCRTLHKPGGNATKEVSARKAALHDQVLKATCEATRSTTYKRSFIAAAVKAAFTAKLKHKNTHRKLEALGRPLEFSDELDDNGLNENASDTDEPKLQGTFDLRSKFSKVPYKDTRTIFEKDIASKFSSIGGTNVKKALHRSPSDIEHMQRQLAFVFTIHKVRELEEQFEKASKSLRSTDSPSNITNTKRTKKQVSFADTPVQYINQESLVKKRGMQLKERKERKAAQYLPSYITKTTRTKTQLTCTETAIRNLRKTVQKIQLKQLGAQFEEAKKNKDTQNLPSKITDTNKKIKQQVAFAKAPLQYTSKKSPVRERATKFEQTKKSKAAHDLPGNIANTKCTQNTRKMIQLAGLKIAHKVGQKSPPKMQFPHKALASHSRPYKPMGRTAHHILRPYLFSPAAIACPANTSNTSLDHKHQHHNTRPSRINSMAFQKSLPTPLFNGNLAGKTPEKFGIAFSEYKDGTRMCNLGAFSYLFTKHR